MTSKEKAEQLFQLYLPFVESLGNMEEIKNRCKKCALIAVDELIKYHDDLMDVVRYELPSNIVAVIPYKYWEDVKKEIEKL